MKAEKEQNIHASCVYFQDTLPPCAVLIRGVPGSGKSDLALRLISEGAQLVGDDQVWLKARGAVLYARPPAQTAGMLEVRGLGLVNFDPVHDVPVRMVVDLEPREDIRRLPERERQVIQGISLPRISLCAYDASAAIKLKLALRLALSEK